MHGADTTLSPGPALTFIMKSQASEGDHCYPNPELHPETTLSNSVTSTQDGNSLICVLIHPLPQTVLAWLFSLNQALVSHSKYCVSHSKYYPAPCNASLSPTYLTPEFGFLPKLHAKYRQL